MASRIKRLRRGAAKFARGYKKIGLPIVRGVRRFAQAALPQYSRQISALSYGLNAAGRGYGAARRTARRFRR